MLSLIHNKQLCEQKEYDYYVYASLVYRLNLAIKYHIFNSLDGAVIVNNNCISSIALKLK